MKRFNNLLVLFDDEFSSMGINRSNKILAFKASSNEIGEAVDFDSSMRVNFPDKGDFPSRNREIEGAFGVDIALDIEFSGQVRNGLPEAISEFPRESCLMFCLGKPSVGFSVMVIAQEPLVCSFKSLQGWAAMSLKHSFLPEGIEALNGGVSAGFSLGDEYQMDSEKQMEPDDLGDAALIPSSTGSGHLIVQLGNLWNSQVFPCLDQMPAQRYALFVDELACKDGMSRNIHGMEGVEADGPVGCSEMSRTHEIGLVEISQFLGSGIGIWLMGILVFWLRLVGLAVSGNNSRYRRDGRNVLNPSLPELPLDNLRSDSSKGRTATPVSFQLSPDCKDLADHRLRSLSPHLLRCTALISETAHSIFFIASEPLGEPKTASLDNPEYIIKLHSFMVELYCFAAFLVFMFALHRPWPLPNVFGSSLGDLAISLRSYDISLVCDVMI
jgi:hypothetical protein